MNHFSKVSSEKDIKKMEVWAKEILDRIQEKLLVVVERNKNKIPYRSYEGHFDDWSMLDIHWWTNGFWGGILWQMYYRSHLAIFKQEAEKVEEKLDVSLGQYKGMDHDNGFKWLPTAVANYRLSQNPESLNRGLLAAGQLAGRFNPAGGFIRAWNDQTDLRKVGWAIIDCLMNLPLLYWASREIKDPRFYHVARRHADKVIENFIREDGSVCHIVEFDSTSGEYVKSYGGQGYKEGSTWTRGQAWAVYGLTLSYKYTKEKKYLESAKRVSDYFIDHIPESGFIPIDFDQPKTCSWEDSTAAAIAASGLLELADCLEDEKANYQKAAYVLLETLVEKRSCLDTDKDYILEKCSAAYHDQEHEFSIIYGDYYLIEALGKCSKQFLEIW